VDKIDLKVCNSLHRFFHGPPEITLKKENFKLRSLIIIFDPTIKGFLVVTKFVKLHHHPLSSY